MEADLRNLGHPHWLKRPQSHVESHWNNEHTAGADLLKDLGGEGESRCGCRDRTTQASKDSLIAFAV